MKRVILTTANGYYFNVLRAFLASMRFNGNDYPLYLDFINGSQEMGERLKRIYPSLGINFIELKNYAECSPIDKLLRLMWTRPPQIMKALNDGHEQIASIDCDLLIRGSLEGLWDDLAPSAFKVFTNRKKKKNSHTFFQGGVQLFGNSPEIKRFYSEFINKLNPEFGFYEGQAGLYKMYKRHRSKVRLVDLPRKYNDDRYRSFNPKSVIWHVKHGRISLDTPFKTEAAEYLKKAEEYERS